jgi:hypothetical protein
MPIPFLSIPDKPISSSTQDFIPIADILDGIVIYKNGGAAQIMESTSLNFDLLSQKEQQAVIASYAGLLNSFNFPVQIVVRSQKKDISIYMTFLTEAKKKIKNPKLAGLMEGYKKFISESIQKKNVLSKKFYIVILFTPYELGIAKSVVSALLPAKKGPLPYPKSYVLRKAKIALFPKREHLIRQAGRLNIKLNPLSNEELMKLFYTIYNPEPPVKEIKSEAGT